MMPPEQVTSFGSPLHEHTAAIPSPGVAPKPSIYRKLFEVVVLEVSSLISNGSILKLCGREQPSSCTQRENIKTRMKLDADKKTVVESWNQFVASLSSAFVNYLQARRIMLYSRLGQVGSLARKGFEQLKEVPIRKLLLAFLPFICYLIVFKFYKEFRNVTHLEKLTPPNYIILSNIESTLFFCHPHRILSSLANPVFDFLAAIPYLFHFPLPFLFAFYLYISPKRRPAIYPFLWCAGWVNLLAVLFQATFPTAPPWFTDSAVIDEHGAVIFEVANEAAFKRIDKLFGISLFHGIYSKSPVKFGAFPSLHVAWPMVVFLNHPWGGKKVGGTHVVWITLAALYATHHYLIDALGGILLAVVVRLCMLRVWSPFPELEKVLAQENGLPVLAEPAPVVDSKKSDTVLTPDTPSENIV